MRDEVYTRLLPEPRHLPIQGKDDRIQYARLACAGRTGDREQIKSRKVNLLRLPKAGETFH
jgi:hypothetical protein